MADPTGCRNVWNAYHSICFCASPLSRPRRSACTQHAVHQTFFPSPSFTSSSRFIPPRAVHGHSHTIFIARFPDTHARTQFTLTHPASCIPPPCANCRKYNRDPHLPKVQPPHATYARTVSCRTCVRSALLPPALGMRSDVDNVLPVSMNERAGYYTRMYWIRG